MACSGSTRATVWPCTADRGGGGPYPHLVDQVLAGRPEELGLHELHARAWAVVEPLFLQAQGKEGRVETLSPPGSRPASAA